MTGSEALLFISTDYGTTWQAAAQNPITTEAVSFDGFNAEAYTGSARIGVPEFEADY